jgi:hypothetical protein
LDGRLNIINEKGSSDVSHAHVGVVRVQDYEDFWNEVSELLQKSPDDTSLSDCHVINQMLRKGKKFKIVKAQKWLDIGNFQSLRESRQAIPDRFDILDKDGESIFIFDDKFVVKFFHDKNYIKNRVSRLKYLKHFGPRLLENTENFYVYEFIKGDEASHFIECKVFRHILTTVFNEYWSPIDESDDFVLKTKMFYFDKTINRSNRFLKDNNIQDEPTVINGEYVDRFEVLIQQIPEDFLCTRKKYYYHGDFVLDNIIIDGDLIKFIDWRQDFCGDVDGGDIYYDLSKLNHSLTINHDLISKNFFSIKEISSQPVKTIEVEVLRKSCHVEFEKILHQFIVEHEFDLKKVNLLTALIWINMAPLHYYPFNNFLYYFGLYNLKKSIDAIRKPTV